MSMNTNVMILSTYENVCIFTPSAFSSRNSVFFDLEEVFYDGCYSEWFSPN